MIYLIDKPKGWTSFDVVAKARSILKEKKIGHAGTLDPNATGLLIIGTGKDTQKLEKITKNTTKTYEATIFLGETRDTDDVEGKLISKNEHIIPTENEVKEVVDSFLGKNEQVPPAYSAIKIKGKKSYDLARQGRALELAPRNIEVYSIKNFKYKYPLLMFTCTVSSGTYIRSLARDIGEKLKTGAYLSDLRRTKVGEYSVEKAISLSKLQQLPPQEQPPR